MRCVGLGAGILVVGIIAVSCGGDDGKLKVYEGAGAGGQSEGGAADTQGGSPESAAAVGGAAAGAISTGPVAGGAAGSSASEGNAGDGSAGGGAPQGTFTPEAPRLALGGPHSCALALDDTVACWGRGDNGELGDGQFYDVAPTGRGEAAAVTGLTGVAAITFGLYHACARLAADDTIVCWGGGNDGQLGDEVFHSNAGVPAPQAVALTGVLQVAAGGNHTCALLNGGSVRCWGDNLFGQLGDGSQNKSAKPLAVPGLSDVQQLAVGKFQTCALMADATVQCWGSGGVNAQAGTVINLLEPTPIEGVTGASALAAGDGFTCAIVTGGAVQCWGEGDVGQLGDGVENDSNTTPVTVPGLSGIVQLSAGSRHVCALGADQSLHCWGDGQFGQLGDGVFHNGFPYYVTQPVAAAVLTDVVEVACGGTHTCVRNGQDEIQCLGSGHYGELGDGVFHNALPFGSATPITAFQL